ncbi:MAG: THUMP domain-containing class I SAM-dependent RNA methyltransferase [Christensenellales bacterium]|jgi:putative N6-adenine-specific DNA methylase
MNDYFATCRFGLEGILANELRRIGAKDVSTRDARVDFSGDFSLLCRANLCLRTAERVFMKIGSFKATSFEELFQGVFSLHWEDYIPKNAAFPVKGKSARSGLHSVPDCQAITKKAIVERLKKGHNVRVLPEDGPKIIVEVGLLEDVATLALDASGAGLNRRGYRTMNAQAPIIETLAAGLVLLSGYRGEGPFLDPMCGSGTIAIEAALIAKNRAPGISREFAAQEWPFLPKSIWKAERERAVALERPEPIRNLCGSDIDESVLKLARFHAKKAGVDIPFTRADVSQLSRSDTGGRLVCNPPYGERLSDRRSCEALYAKMGRAFSTLRGWQAVIISSHPGFEKSFGRRANKRRKLYNSGLPCQAYIYKF